MRSPVKRLTTTACAALASLVLLAGCSDSGSDASDQGDDAEGAAAVVEVEVGKEFTWNGFTVADGWKLSASEQTINMEKVQRPFITGKVTNEDDEARFAVFEFAFVSDGTLESTIRCTSDKIPSGNTVDLGCPGFEKVPSTNDRIQVREITR